MTVNVVAGVDVRPAASVAVQLTVVVPAWNVEPLAGVHTATMFWVTASVTTGAYVATAVPVIASAVSVRLPGLVMVGGVVSTVTQVKHGRQAADDQCQSSHTSMSQVGM